MKVFNKINEKIKLYGYWNSIIILLKLIINRILHISWDKYYLLSLSINTDKIELQQDNKFIIKEISLEDYNNELWKDFLNEGNKRLKYIERFNNKNAKAFGAFVDKNLAYTCWILYGKILIRGIFDIDIPKEDGLLLDDYCHPQFRGKGIHKYAINWRITQIAKNGGKKCYTVVLSYNKPALKSLYKCGLKIEKSFYIYKIGKNIKCTLKNT